MLHRHFHLGTIMPQAAGFAPLKPDVFEILMALADGDLHGYAILKVLESRGLRVAASPLYRKLYRLMEDGLVVEAPSRRRAGDDARRRYYRLTSRGLEIVRAEAARIVGLARNPEVRRLAEGASHG
jgi:DNA-binding PadR family transcriptional regulator